MEEVREEKVIEKTDKTSREISLKDLWQIFIKKLWIIASVALIAVIGSFAVIKLTYSPIYESESSLFIGASDGDSEIQEDDLNNAFNFFDNYAHIILTRKVLAPIVDELDYVKDLDKLKKSIKIEKPDANSHATFLEISVKADIPAHAKEINEKLCESMINEVNQNYAYAKIKVHDEATLPEKPCNKKGFTTYFLIGFIAAVVTYIILLIIYVVDDRIKSDEEICSYLGLSVLGNIPNVEELNKKRGAYKYAYKSEVTGHE